MERANHAPGARLRGRLRASTLLWLGAGLLLAAGSALAGCSRGAPPGERTAEAEPDSTTRSVYFVRLVDDADPAAVLETYDLVADTLYEDRIRAFRGSFTREEAQRLEEDSRVRSVSIRIESEGWSPPDPLSPPDTSPPDSGGDQR